MRGPVGMAALLAVATGCANEELLHGLDEPAANDVVVALDDGGVVAGKRREDGPDGRFTITVRPRDATRAQRVLAERELPRARPPGFGDVFGKGSMVPTPTEEHALYLHALAGELARSIETIDGVVEARVHLGLPRADPLRPGDRPAPRGAVLVKCRPASCDTVRALADGIRSLVAGAADGLDAASVSVVVAPGSESRPPPSARSSSRRGSPVLLGLAAMAGAGAIGFAGAGFRSRPRGEKAP
jgi:type III secretion protein J